MASESGTDDGETTLEDVVVALQKSFSRVSSRSETSRRDSPEAPLAVISGPVQFSISLRLRPDGSDRLIYDENAGIETTLAGTVTPDVRLQVSDESATEAADPAGEPPAGGS